MTTQQHVICIPRWQFHARSHNQFDDHCFATTGPTLWNSLPEQLWQLNITFGQFKRSLKTLMFG